ncbi:hypothetical protein BBM25_22480 [Vibrio parahaemolyticus]|uniref:hypothetical protein n=1 Tax=Vibrio parahaemolyticus TaxID=670 RepID=UPI00084B534F|nr:hypothetical protein [Vibrio parahaemolyticus]ODY45237.1 hypothetical protein BBM25_22480 [Vibrio parahaemolyticus]
MIHLVSDCTHLTQCPKLLVQIKQSDVLTPVSMVKGGGAELSLSVADGHQLELIYNKWKEMGVDFIQPPMTSVYGLNFVATDPDKHRIRVFISE